PRRLAQQKPHRPSLPPQKIDDMPPGKPASSGNGDYIGHIIAIISSFVFFLSSRGRPRPIVVQQRVSHRERVTLMDGSRPPPIGANLRRKLPLRPRSRAGEEGGAKRRMRAATRSGAVVPLASPSRCRAPALIRPRSQACAGCASLPAMGTFSQPAVGRRGNRARPVPNLAPMGLPDDGTASGTSLGF